MKKILHIISSPRGDASFSIKLGNAVVEQLLQSYPGSSVKTYDVTELKFPHLEQRHITSFYTPADLRTGEHHAALQYSDEAVATLFDADIIVIGAPMYNYTIGSALKAWLDQVVRAGVTFSISATGAQGLVTGKKAYIAQAAGGVYSEGPMQALDFTVPYLKPILNHIGITEISVFRVEGTAIPGVQDTALAKGIESIVID